MINRLPIDKGEFALVDDDFVFNRVKNMKWKFWSGKGVVSYDKKQAILLHNMISSCARVSFINGDKKDCRKANLIPWNNRFLYSTNFTKGKLIYDIPQKNQIEFRFNIRKDGKLLTYTKNFSYNNRTKKEAVVKAQEAKKKLLSIPKKEIINVILNKKNTKQAIGKLIYDRKRYGNLDIRRSVMINGRTYVASVSLSYKNQSKAEIQKTAIKIRDRFAAMPSRQFATWTLSRPKWKPTGSEIIRGWSGYEDRECTYREVKDMNISHMFDER